MMSFVQSWVNTVLGLCLCTGLSCGAIPQDAQRFVSDLGLSRTAYGTYFKPTWCSPFNTTELPSRFAGGSRPLSSSIYNLYARDPQNSGPDQAGYPLHKLQSDEAWFFFAGDGMIELFEFDLRTAKMTTVQIGVQKGAVPQYTVPANTWVGALLPATTSWVLTGAQNTPAYDPRDATMATADAKIVAQLRAKFPTDAAILDRLLSF
eukprot:m.105957 g.105957  ORF g.105957 m.105957 type:complete len:206 (+) comp16886_c0_seq1:116-733(+)